MATLKLTIVPAKRLIDGRHKIRVSLAHNSETRYIPTDCIIDNESEFRDGMVIGRPDASSMNVRLRNILNYYQDIIDHTSFISGYSCSELRELLVRKKDYNNAKFSDAMSAYLEELKEDERHKSEKLYRLACSSFIRECGDLFLTMITPRDIKKFRKNLEKRRLSPTTVRIYMTLVKVVVHFAEKRKMCRYEDDPFEDVQAPAANVRELDLTVDELKAIRDLVPSKYNVGIARDIFMLSYYLGGMNLVDMLEVDFRKSYIEYYRQKTKNKKHGESKTAFSIQPEAREIIKKYMKPNGRLVFGKFDTFGKAYSVISRKMEAVAELAGVSKRVVFYSARKSFVQHGFDLGIALETLEYCIGQSMKTNRPIFNYVRVMRNHADNAMRKIFDNLL